MSLASLSLRTKAAFALLALSAMVSCASSATGPSKTYQSAKHGFAITYPADLVSTPTFTRSYLQIGAWSVFARPDRHRGTPVVALVMPRSDNITAGELRIGLSRAPADVAACTTAPMGARADSMGTTVIDGTTFTTFEGGDAAMNHYLAVKGYRTVHEGACYAIEVLVIGTNPEVYDPPATPPFTRQEAFATLTPVVRTFRFIDEP